MNHSKTIRQAREAQNMTQEHLAMAAGVSKRTVIRAEKGQPVSAETVRALASVLGIDLTSPAEPGPIDPLFAQIEAAGETIVWEGRPDRESWAKTSKAHLHAAFCLFLVGITLLGIIPYVRLAVGALKDAEMPLSILYALGLPVGAALIWRVAGQMRRRIARTAVMSRTRFVISDAGFYRATERKDGSLLSVARTSLQPGSTVVRERAAYVMWPWCRAVDVIAKDSRDVVEGVDGIDGRLRECLSTEASLRQAA